MSDEKEKIPMPKANFKVDANPGSHVKKMIGVVSGKGGVGKSSVTGDHGLRYHRSLHPAHVRGELEGCRIR